MSRSQITGFSLPVFPYFVRAKSCLHAMALNKTKLSAGVHCRKPSLNRTDVAKSAVVLHWQGTNSSLKPVLISNSDGVSGFHVSHGLI